MFSGPRRDPDEVECELTSGQPGLVMSAAAFPFKGNRNAKQLPPPFRG
jgi:hypothetical protein